MNGCYRCVESLLLSRLLSQNLKIKIYIKNVVLFCVGVKLGVSH